MINQLLIDELQDVWNLATKQHDRQKYGGAEEGQQVEYLSHIGSVAFEVIAASLIEKDIDASLAIKCAVLHDTIEDTGLTFGDIMNRYGAEVANGVLALTKDSTVEGKKEKMLDSLKRIKLQPKSVWAVKMADRICNLYAPPYYWTNEKKLEYVEEAKLIHAELKEGSAYLAGRLMEKVNAYQRFIK